MGNCMRVVFLAPVYPAEMPQFARGLAEVGAEVLGVGDTAPEALPDSLKRDLSGYLQVPRLMDEDDIVERVSAWLKGQPVDQVLTNWEPLVIAAAKLRERWGIPGMSVDTVRGFRDKQLMKERVAAAGVRVPRSRRIKTVEEAREAAEAIGYPLVFKPIAGAGSADTYAARDEKEFEDVLRRTQGVSEASVEEYIEGEEFTYDTVCLGGEPVFDNVAQYLPKPLEARSEEWISPVIITVRDLEQPKMKKGVELGRKVLKALNMGDGFTHMEWFYTPKGEAVFGEIGCRPGGARLVDQMNYTADVDLYREWARVACYGKFEGPTERKYNCGVIFKRAIGKGRITGITGLGHYKARFHEWILEDHLLRPGEHRRNWLHTLVSDGYLLVRHPDWEEAKRMSFAAATDVTLYAE
jgi:biotin carboxylase